MWPCPASASASSGPGCAPIPGQACGGHAVDYEAPMHQQWTDMQLVTQDDVTWPGRSPLSDAFDFTSPHEQCFDFGQFDYIRPAVTVIGCCHLFSREGLRRPDGGRHAFDVRFSPSQSDDVDLDMRSWLAGRPCLFQGHLHVRHKRNSGGGKRCRRSETSAVCNWHKLQGSYDAEEIRQLADANRKALLADLAERLSLLGEVMDLPWATPKPLAASRDAAERFRLSVVIPTCDRCDILARCLAALETQTLASGLFEVLVIDDGSEDGTSAFLQTYALAFAFRHFRQQERGGPARARNRGASGKPGAASSSFLTTTPYWSRPAWPRTLRAMTAWRAVGCPCWGNSPCLTRSPAHSGAMSSTIPDLLFDYANMRPGCLYGANQYYTCNVSTPRGVLFEVGLFDEAFTGTWWGAEDIDIGLRLAQAAPPVPVRSTWRAALPGMMHRSHRPRISNACSWCAAVARCGCSPRPRTPGRTTNDIRAEDVAFLARAAGFCRAALDVFQEVLSGSGIRFPTGRGQARAPDGTGLPGRDTTRARPVDATRKAPQRRVAGLYGPGAGGACAFARADGTAMIAAARRLYPVCLFARWLYDTLGVCAVPDIERFMATRRPPDETLRG